MEELTSPEHLPRNVPWQDQAPSTSCCGKLAAWRLHEDRCLCFFLPCSLHWADASSSAPPAHSVTTLPGCRLHLLHLETGVLQTGGKCAVRRLSGHASVATCRWQRLEAQKLDSLGREDIPWPPDQAMVLQSTARLAMDAGSTQGSMQTHTHPDAVHRQLSEAAHKQAYRTLSLRWHPDKFQAKYGHLLLEEDQEAIMQHVCSIFQCVSSQWQSHLKAGLL